MDHLHSGLLQPYAQSYSRLAPEVALRYPNYGKQTMLPVSANVYIMF